MSTTTPLDQQRQLVRNFLAANKQRAERENTCQKQFAASERAAQEQHSAAEKAAQAQHAAALQQAATQRNQAKNQIDGAAANIEKVRASVAVHLAAMDVAGLPPGLLPRLEATHATAPSSATNADPLPQFQSAARRIGDLAQSAAQMFEQWQQQRKRQQTMLIAAAVAVIVLAIGVYLSILIAAALLAVVLVVAGVYLFQQWSYSQAVAGFYQAGNAALAAEDWQAANNQFSELLFLEPDYQDAQVLLKESLYGGGKAAVDVEDWQTAHTLFNELFILDSSYRDAQSLINQHGEDIGITINARDGAIYVYIPAGEFLMGSPDGQGDDDEHPQHAVTLDAYWIMQTEVTNSQYAQCVAAGACSAPKSRIWQDADRADHPVTDVNWQQASDYATWAGGRLPSEAEWEKAARGTDRRTYPWGNAAPTNELANCYEFVNHTMPVGSYPKGVSPYGAMDMAGNVWEWTADWYDSGYYSQSPEQNPTGPASGTSRVIRGGAYYGAADVVRSAVRAWSLSDDLWDGLGFRVVSSPSAVDR